MKIEYYYSVVSPFSYLGLERFKELIEKNNITVKEKPIDLVGKVFTETGGVPVSKRSIQRQKYRLVEIERFKQELKIDIKLKPKFFPPFDPHAPAKFIIAAIETGNVLTAGYECLKALWSEEKDISQIDELKKIAEKLDLKIEFNDDFIYGLSHNNDKIQKSYTYMNSIYAKNSLEAIEKGVFGAPTYIFENEIFWGQDRLNFLEKAILKK